MNYIKKLFSGRIGSLGYLLGNLFAYLFYLLFDYIGVYFSGNMILEWLSIVGLLFMIVFSFSLAVRRLHDLDKSGLMSLLLFIPFINLIITVYLIFKQGSNGNNQYGKPPRDYKYLVQDIFSL